MRIKSINDVITNSSDETYIIKTDDTPDEAFNKFMEYVKKYFPEDYDPDDYTLTPNVTEYWCGGLEFDWGAMCNVSKSYGILCTLFGAHNIKER